MSATFFIKYSKWQPRLYDVLQTFAAIFFTKIDGKVPLCFRGLITTYNVPFVEIILENDVVVKMTHAPNELDREMIEGENGDESQKEAIRYPDSEVYPI